MNKISTEKKTSKVRILVDMFFFALMVLVLIPQSTGVPIHEWASFIILLPLLLHVTINWNWIAANSAKFFKRQPNKTRFDYVLNWSLYLLMIIVTVSGIAISESALPLFGIHMEPDGFWSPIHDISATLFMAVLGIHIALHWKWIIGAMGKLKLKSDFHHLTKISTITIQKYRQILLIIGVSLLLSLIIWMFNYSEWANEARISSIANDSEGARNRPDSWMIYVLPLLKITIIMTIPALITGGMTRLRKKILSRANYR